MDPLESRIDKSAKTPAHIQVRSRLLALIRTQTWPRGHKLPSEPEIAQRLGVSRMTANKALVSLAAEGWLIREKGRGTFVGQDPQVLISRVAVAIHADPATAVDDHYFGGLYWPLQTEFARRQVTVDLVRIGPSMVAEGSQGLVAINPSEHELDDLLEYARGGAPVVVLGASWSDYGFSQVDSDNLLGAMLAMNHLIDLGHQKILVVGACPQDSNTRDRMEGAMRAIKGRQLPHRDEHFLMLPDVNELRAEHRARLRKLLRASDSPSAIFAGGAQTAMQLFAFCRELGLEVPGQISLVGYDDPSFLSMAYPPITTVRQPLAEMALNACELLLDRAITRDPRSERRLLDPELVVRGTTAPYSPTDA